MTENDDLRLGAISFDIDGTMEFGEPPGLVTVDMVRRARKLGFIIGSCSDRPLSTQQRFWQEAGVEVDFTVLKQNLEHVKRDFELASYLHIGDTPLDNRMATAAGFDFLHVEVIDTDGVWLVEYHGRHPNVAGEPRVTVPPNVLLAEDITGYRERITAMLAPLGLNLTGAADGLEAIQFIEAGHPLDLLITDLEMPRKNGWQVIESFRELRDPALPIIMQTGEAKDPWVIEKAAALGIVLIDKAHVDIALSASVRAALGMPD